MKTAKEIATIIEDVNLSWSERVELLKLWGEDIVDDILSRPEMIYVSKIKDAEYWNDEEEALYDYDRFTEYKKQL